MTPSATPQNASEPRLTSLSHGGGCGCKIAPGVLSEILKGTAAMPIPPQLLVGIEVGEQPLGNLGHDTMPLPPEVGGATARLGVWPIGEGHENVEAACRVLAASLTHGFDQKLAYLIQLPGIE